MNTMLITVYSLLTLSLIIVANNNDIYAKSETNRGPERVFEKIISTRSLNVMAQNEDIAAYDDEEKEGDINRNQDEMENESYQGVAEEGQVEDDEIDTVQEGRAAPEREKLEDGLEEDYEIDNVQEPHVAPERKKKWWQFWR